VRRSCTTSPFAVDAHAANDETRQRITLIVQPETISDTVFVYGAVKTAPSLQEPPARKASRAFSRASIRMERRRSTGRAFSARSTDRYHARGGSSFGLQTTTHNFDRAITLLAQNELTPRLDQPTFDVVRRRAIDTLQTELNSSHSIALQRRGEVAAVQRSELREPSISGMQGISLDETKAYYAKTMRPDLATIVWWQCERAASARVDRARVRRLARHGSDAVVDLPAVPINPPAT